MIKLFSWNMFIWCKQNLFLKLLFSLISAVFIAKQNSFFIFLMLVYFMPSPKIYWQFFKTVPKFLPFFITYFLMGILLDLRFDLQIIFCSKVLFFLLLSSYMTKTSGLKEFIGDLYFVRKRLLFIVTTMKFVNCIISQYY